MKPLPDLSEPGSSPAEPKMVRESRWSLLLQCVFFGFAFWFLCVINRDYLFLLQEYNLFLNSFSFLWKHCIYAGGPLDYVTCFLAQFFLCPYCGGGILLLLLILIRKQTEKLFHLNGNGKILSFVPPFLLIWFFTQPGYAVFADIRINALCSVFIGILLALSFAVWYSRFVSPIHRSVFCSLGTILLYYLAGIYGLLGALLCLFHECSLPRNQRRLAYCVFPILCALSTPFLLFWLRLTKTNLVNAYRIGIPSNITTDDYAVFFDSILFEIHILLASLLAFAVLRLVWHSKLIQNVVRHKKNAQSLEKNFTGLTNGIHLRFAALNVILLVLVCCATYIFSHARGDFLVTAKMCRLVCEENWEGVLQIRYENENPAFPIMLFRQLALFKLDRIADEVFTYPTTMSIDESQWTWCWNNRMFGDHILFEYGLVNAAFRVAMIQYSMKESTISNLRILALSAMANEEYEVAEKYLRLIKQSLFYGNWAQNHIDYIESCRSSGQAETVAMSHEVQTINRRLNNIRKLMPVVNETENSKKMGLMISRGFMRKNIEEAADEVRTMFLVQLLLCKDLPAFREYYDLWADELYADHIPRHFQEALIIEITPEGIDARAAQYGISPDLGKQFITFMQILESTVQRGEPVDSNSTVSREFGDTFWFYFLMK